MKNKVLFIVSDFFHGGAQREMYELDCALNRNEIEVYILCVSDLKSSNNFSDFFYEKHKDLGTNISFYSELFPKKKESLKGKVLRKLKIEAKLIDKENKIKTFFDSFTQVFFMGEYVYTQFENNIDRHYFLSTNIVIMSGRFQGEKYRNFDKKRKYNFISPCDTEEQVLYEFEGFKDFRHHFFPLSFSINKSLNKWFFTDNEIKKIGIFTRLSSAKPLDPFFYTFHLLLKELPNVELHIFGAGNYKEAGYDRYLNHLNLNDKVIFRGHQADMKKTLNEENLNLVWFQGYLNRPAGYAGQDVSVTGTPMLLWDFFNGVNPNINSLDYVYPHFKDLNSFVKASKDVLLDKDIATNVSKKQFNDVLENKDMQKNIKKIEHLIYGENG